MFNIKKKLIEEIQNYAFFIKVENSKDFLNPLTSKTSFNRIKQLLANLNEWLDPNEIFPEIEVPFLGIVNNNEFFPNDPCICIIEKQDPHKDTFNNFNNTINNYPNLWMNAKGMHNHCYLSIKSLIRYKYI